MARTRMLAATGIAAVLMANGMGTGVPGAGAAPGAPAAPVAPAQAAGQYPIPLVGDFTGDAREEVFVYWPGSATESLVSFTPTATGFTTTKSAFQVNGTYRPVVADIDPDPLDEIIWYGPGTTIDTIWDFTSASTATSRPTQVDGRYLPVAGNLNGVGNDEVFWYAPGSNQDSIWTFDDAGNRTSVPQLVNGTGFVPVVESYGADDTDDIIWYDPDGADPDFLWDFAFGDLSHTSRQLNVTRTYDPVALDAWGDGFGGGDVFWYGSGTAPDFLWDFRDGNLAASVPLAVNQHHRPIVSGDLLGDGWDDVLFFRDVAFDTRRTAVLWDHEVSGTTLRRDVGELVASDWIANGFPTTAHAWMVNDQVVATR